MKRQLCLLILLIAAAAGPSYAQIFHKALYLSGTRLMDSGIHSKTFTGSNGCDSVSTVYLIPLPVPEVNISYRQDPPFCYQETILLEAAGAGQYTWYHTYGAETADGPELTLYLSRLSGKVTVVGSSENECRDTAVISIDAVSCCRLSVPNAFSPNNDARNDRFRISSNSRLRNYRMQIYNRWGQLVFTGYDLNDAWDGNLKGAPAEVGTYFYQISHTCPDGTEQHTKGDITLIR